MEGVLKNPVHNGDQLAEFISVMVGVPLVFGCAPALFVGYAQFYPQGVLLGVFPDTLSLRIQRGARNDDFVRFSCVVYRQGKVNFALKLLMT